MIVTNFINLKWRPIIISTIKSIRLVLIFFKNLSDSKKIKIFHSCGWCLWKPQIWNHTLIYIETYILSLVVKAKESKREKMYCRDNECNTPRNLTFPRALSRQAKRAIYVSSFTREISILFCIRAYIWIYTFKDASFALNFRDRAPRLLKLRDISRREKFFFSFFRCTNPTRCNRVYADHCLAIFKLSSSIMLMCTWPLAHCTYEFSILFLRVSIFMSYFFFFFSCQMKIFSPDIKWT